MSERTGNFSTQANIARYVQYLLELRLQAGQALQENRMQDFQGKLSQLYQEYFAKFDKREDIDRPEWAEQQRAGVKSPENISQLNTERQKSLFIQICKLQESLGHTSIETEDWKQTEI